MTNNKKRLGVNIDHIASLRQLRGGLTPDPIQAANIVENAGADGIVVHLREDRRHINDRDLKTLKQVVVTHLNLEMSINPEIVAIAAKTKPDQVTLVPEKRQELTTEGGLDTIKLKSRISKVISKLQSKGIKVSLFIEPNIHQIQTAKSINADAIEIHTGKYALSSGKKQKNELLKIKKAAQHAKKIGLSVFAGHGLNYHNVKAIADIDEIEELNIGYSIITRAVFFGLKNAIKEMINLIK